MAEVVSDHVIDAASLPACPAADSQVVVSPVTLKVKVGNKTVRSLSVQATPSTAARLTVLLLHGRMFDSHHWVETNTLRLLASWGYHAIAVDLPGYGCSMDYSLYGIPLQVFLSALVETLPSPLVIIIPNASVGNVLAQMFSGHSEGSKRESAFIPVPLSDRDTSGLLFGTDQQSQLPSLVVFGSRDGSRFCKHSELEVVPAPTNKPIVSRMRMNVVEQLTGGVYGKGVHSLDPSYVETSEADLFNNVLYHFISTLELRPAVHTEKDGI